MGALSRPGHSDWGGGGARGGAAVAGSMLGGESSALLANGVPGGIPSAEGLPPC